MLLNFFNFLAFLRILPVVQGKNSLFLQRATVLSETKTDLKSSGALTQACSGKVLYIIPPGEGEWVCLPTLWGDTKELCRLLQCVVASTEEQRSGGTAQWYRTLLWLFLDWGRRGDIASRRVGDLRMHLRIVKNLLWSIQMKESRIYPEERGYKQVSYEKVPGGKFTSY